MTATLPMIDKAKSTKLKPSTTEWIFAIRYVRTKKLSCIKYTENAEVATNEMILVKE